MGRCFDYVEAYCRNYVIWANRRRERGTEKFPRLSDNEEYEGVNMAQVLGEGIKDKWGEYKKKNPSYTLKEKTKHKDELMNDYSRNSCKFFNDYILIDMPENLDCWVAGGALRDFYLYGYIKGETDIDIFTTCQANFDVIRSTMQEYYREDSESEFAVTFKERDDEEKIVQIIKIFYNNPQECIMNFDLACCCAYIGKKGDTFLHDAAEEFYDDNFDKKIRLLKLNDNPNSTLYRIKKYQGKGYRISDNELLAMTKCYLDGDYDLDELVETYNGLRLMSEVDDD